MNHIHNLTAQRDNARDTLKTAHDELTDILVYLSSDKFARPDNDYVHISTDIMPKLMLLRLMLSQDRR